jgi:hypothetical protein
MNRKIAYILGAIAGMAFFSQAQASTIVSGAWHLNATTDTSGWTSYSHSLSDFDSLTKNSSIGNSKAHATDLGGGNSVYGNNTKIRNGSGSTYAAPWLSTPAPKGAADKTNYMTVQADGKATFTLATPAHYFGFLWGSVDKFNKISFLGLGDKLLATFTGADMPTSNGKSGLGGSYYANFTTSEKILKVVLTSTCDAFEIDNVRVSTVPVPAALPLFGAALVGMGLVSRRRRKTSSVA